ncbi:MAG: S8 family serine peptidase [Clostridiales bacterium]|nr:S8 family serine peptidase [Clostridiales bacterium]
MIFVFFACASAAFIASGTETAGTASAYDFSKVGVSALPEGFNAGELWYDASEYLNMRAVAATVASWAADGLLPDPFADGFEPVKIAVIDTGIFFGHELYEGLYCYDENGLRLSYDGYRGTEGANAAQADISEDHGPHVNGTAAAFIKELGLQDYIKLLPIKATSVVSYPDGKPTKSFVTTHVIRSMEWAHAHGADVITLSLGSRGELAGAVWNGGYMRDALEKIRRDCIILAAAGNDGADSAADPHYPSLLDGFLSVMSFMKGEPDRRLSSFSNYGGYDLAAPGNEIYSVAYNASSGTVGYGKKQGTSMATPIAAASAALLTLRFRYVEKASDFNALALTEIMKRHSDTRIFYKSGMSSPLPQAAYALSPLALATKDFRLDDLYLAAEEVRMSAKGYLNQTFGEYSEVKLSASPYPLFTDPSVETEWFKNGVKVASGREFSFTPSEIGDTEIFAAADGVKSATVRICVSYKTVYPYQCKIIASEERPRVKRDVILRLSGAEHADPSRIVWFVNGEEYAAGVSEITLSREKSSVVSVSAALDGEPVESYILEITDYTLWVALAAAGGALLLAAVIVLPILKRKKTARYENPERTDFE